ncbi:MAG TPA: hypothetical protein VJ957_08205, partial [Longimicrobiales bacterium]|nr:hypothetical protein [Longimicrobiales bacterium]
NEAALLAARRNRTEVSMSEIDEAIDRVVAGLEKRNRLINDRERQIVAYHETGHAVVAERVEFADPVHKVSIVPRGVGALGYTQQLPESDRYLLQRRELLDRLAVLLGGRVAEEIVFDEISTGASNDLERASDIARRMVRQYGMSETIGLVTYEHERRSFLDRNGGGGPHVPGAEPREFSEATAEIIDNEVHKIVTAAHDRAEKVLRGERSALDRIAKKLLQDEVISRAELRSLLDLDTQASGSGGNGKSSGEPAPDPASDAEHARA